MELTLENFRTKIYFNFQLTSTFGDEALSYGTVKHWDNEPNRRHRSLSDESRLKNSDARIY